MKKFYYLSTVFLALLLFGGSVQTTAQSSRVVQPTSTGIQWVIGNTYNIVWTLNPAECVDIYLSDQQDLSGSYTKIFNNLGSGTTSQAWTPSQAEGDYYIVITNCDGTTFLASSINSFELVTSIILPPGEGTIHVNQPNVSGIQWKRGTTQGIYWDDDLTEPVKLELWYNDGAGYVQYTGTTNLPTSVQGTGYLWHIPSGIDQKTTYKIYIKSTTTDVWDDGDNEFTITDALSGGTYANVIQPGDESGLRWVSGTNHLISWMDDYIEPVRIKLFRFGSEVPLLPAESGIPDVNRTGTTWNWHIPAVTTLVAGTYQIRLFSSVSGDQIGAGVETFTIVAVPSGGTYIDVIQPDISGIEWRINTNHLISWVDDVIEPVKIKLVNSVTGDVGPATSGIPDVARTGSTWNWHIPNTPSLATDPGTYTIVITSSVNATPVGESENPFDIINYTPDGEILVIQPNGDEEWIKGNSYLISWTDNISEKVTIEVTDNNWVPADTYLLTAATGVSGSTWTWNTNTNWPAGLDLTGTDIYKIRVTSVNPTTVTDDSDAAFSFVQTTGGNVVLYQPDGGEIINDHSQYLISWVDELAEKVHIRLLYNGTEVAQSVSGFPASVYTGSGVSGSTYVWHIPETGGTDIDSQLIPGDGYQVRVQSIYDPSYGATSATTFTILDDPQGGSIINVIQPNGGEVWALNTSHLISWDDDVIENVNIDLVDENFVFITSIATNVPGTTRTWNISSSLYGVGTYRIHIYSPATGSIASDYSDEYFTISATKSPNTNINLGGVNVSEVTIYPNPTSTQFTVAAPTTINLIEVRNMLGQVMLSSSVESAQISIDVSGYEAGIYIVNVVTNEGVVTKKLFVQ